MIKPRHPRTPDSEMPLEWQFKVENQQWSQAEDYQGPELIYEGLDEVSQLDVSASHRCACRFDSNDEG